jgi:protein HOOK3
MFTDSWLSKIKTDVGSNWRLKVSNLKKIVDAVFEYYSDSLNSSLAEEVRPDVMKIVENGDQVELGRLLQLILGCAVNCANKQKYITQIMDLEEELQRNIMRALQDIEQATPRNSISMTDTQDLKTTQDERDVLAQKCHEAHKKISILHDEKATMQQELLKLQYLVEKYENPNIIGDDGTSLGPVQLGSTRYNDLRKQVDILKDELLQAETARDDLKMKSSQQESEIVAMQVKIEELNVSVSP